MTLRSAASFLLAKQKPNGLLARKVVTKGSARDLRSGLWKTKKKKKNQIKKIKTKHTHTRGGGGGSSVVGENTGGGGGGGERPEVRLISTNGNDRGNEREWTVMEGGGLYCWS